MIYICIPSYNEARTVGVLLWKIRQVMAGFHRDYQILVVDDGSTDDTPAVLEPYKRVLPLTVFRNEVRRGYAASLELLLREAVQRATYPRRDVIVTLQADFTDEPEEIPAFVKRIEGGADVVTGTMVQEPGSGPRAARWMRRALAFVLRRSEWPGPLTDPLSGFRAFRVACIKKAIEARNGGPLLRWDGWAANAELLQLMRPYCRRIEEAPVRPRPDRRLRPTRFNTWETARALVRFLRSRPATNGVPQAPRAGQTAPAAKATTVGNGTAAAPQARPQRRRRRRRHGGEARQPTAGVALDRREAGSAEAASAGPEAAAAQADGPQSRGGAPARRGGNRRRGRHRTGRRPQRERATGGTAAGGDTQTRDEKVGPQS